MSNKDGPKHERKSPISARKVKKLLVLKDYLSKQESKNTFKLVSRILLKGESERTEEELTVLRNNKEVVKRIQKNKERKLKTEERTQEREDSEKELQQKCAQLAQYIKKAKRAVVYTGAGISTAASIPDYRGPQGVWTLLQKGESLEPLDLSDAEPTFTHMCIAELQSQGHVKHVVSQNCDGLHLRSGLSRRALSEVHGNMFIEVCYKCKPHREYVRLFDTTENTGVRRHQTGRVCRSCRGQLRDTIVHFGEKGGLKSPYRWKEAAKAAEKSDLILCLGSSLKILKCYGCLWLLDRTKDKRPNLVIVNLQWTPKDDSASLKINGRCDDVLERVMKILGYSVKSYVKDADPIFRLCTPLTERELDTTSKKVLDRPNIPTDQHSFYGISTTPTPSDSESSTSSSSDSSDTDDDVEIDCENPENENNLEEIINAAKKVINEGNDGKLPAENVNEVKEESDCENSHLVNSVDKTVEHKSLIADNFHDYAHSITHKAEPAVSGMNRNHFSEPSNADSLHSYRQLLHLHLLQKQLEWLKSQQRNQQSQQTSPGSTHLPAGPPPFSVPPHISQGQFPVSSRSYQITPGSYHMSLDAPHISTGLGYFSSGSLEFSQGCYASPTQSAPFPVGIYPNHFVFPPAMQMNSNEIVHQAQDVKNQLEYISSNNMHPGSMAQLPDGLKSVEQIEMQLKHQTLENQMKVIDKIQKQNFQLPKAEGFHFPSNHQTISFVNNVPESVSQPVTNSNVPYFCPQNSLNSTIQNCLQNIINPNKMAVENSRQIQNLQKQQQQVQEIQKQMELEQNRLKEQEIKQNILKDLIGSSLSITEGTKGIQTMHKEILNINHVTNERPQMNKNVDVVHTADFSQLHGTIAPAGCSVKDNVSCQTSCYNENMFKQPPPYQSYTLKHTEAKRNVSVGHLKQNHSLPIKSSANSSSSSENCDSKGQTSGFDRTSNQTKSEIPGFSELVNSLTMCQSCQFLREYGVNKRSCSMCKDLKAAHNVLNTQWMPQRQPEVLKSPTKHASPPGVSNAAFVQSYNSKNIMLNSDKSRSRSRSFSSHTYSEKDLEEYYDKVKDTNIAGKTAAMKPVSRKALGNDLNRNGLDSRKQVLTGHNFNEVSPRKCTPVENDSNSDQKPMFDLGCSEEIPNCEPVQCEESTSKTLDLNPSKLSRAFRTNMHVNSVIDSDTYQPSVVADDGFVKKCRVSSEPDLSKSAEKRKLDGDSDVNSISEVESLKRSHSQSEMEGNGGELNEGVEEIDSGNETSQATKKRKLTRCVSVPGWFGKGLTIKKRRKY